jgi:hypothetical protein
VWRGHQHHQHNLPCLLDHGHERRLLFVVPRLGQPVDDAQRQVVGRLLALEDSRYTIAVRDRIRIATYDHGDISCGRRLEP